MNMMENFIIEKDGQYVYSSPDYKRVRHIALSLIKQNPDCEIIVHSNGIIVGI